MPQLPHPETVILLLEQRQAEYLAAGERYRLAALTASPGGAPRVRHRPDLMATATGLIAWALSVSAGRARLKRLPLAPNAVAPRTVQ